MNNIEEQKFEFVTINLIGKWEEYKNMFYDIPPPTEADRDRIIIDVRRFYDPQGNLLGNECKYTYLFDRSLMILKYENWKYTIDVGWYPDFDPNGCYGMQLIKDNDWDTSLIDYNTRDKDEMLKKIHETMQWVVDQEEKLS
jgi:hypothetical protein